MDAAHHHTTRNRLNAWLLARAEAYMHRKYGPRKKAIFKDLPAKVVEIGPGTGANLRYYPPGTALTAVEPNPAMHPRLRAEASRRGIDLTIRGRKGEALDLPDESVGAVVATLVLCSVDNPRQVVSEIRRVLEPGGRFFFLEHVAALTGTPLNRFQALLAKPWQWLFDGCHLNRETHQVMARAGFQSLDMDCFMLASPAVMIMPHIFGIAVK
jgi:SAM-dependent methyltransferase